MRVEVHPADEGGCGWYRLRWPAQVLQADGYDVTCAEEFESVLLQQVNGREQVNDVLNVDVDVVVFQRPLLRQTFEMIRPLQKRGIAVVVDIDDDFHSIPDGHTFKAPGVQRPDRSSRWVRRACEEADLVTVTTPALAERYGAHGRVVVLPNMVPASYLDVPRLGSSASCVVGWTGSVLTHVGDLEATGGGVARAVETTGARFHVIGTGTGVRDALGLEEHPSSTAGWVSLTDYPHVYAGLDVAIVPLAANPFNEAKSDLKGLEAAAVGVPFVASSTGPYRGLVNSSCGAGLIAESPSSWRDQVTRLVKDSHLRAQLAEQGRGYVEVARTYEGQAWRWMEAWEQAVKHCLSRPVCTA